MNFINLTPTAVIAGITVLAVLLFALQQLRTRYRTLIVPTAMFWQQAAQDAPVRVFRQKFKHWLAYLLTLLIAGLLWLGFAEPEIKSQSNNEYYILYLDGSAAMTQNDDFQQAVNALKQDISAFPINRREVIFGGDFHTKMLNASEQVAILNQRLSTLKPESTPDSFDEQVSILNQRFTDSTPVKVIVYGKSPLPQSPQSNISYSHGVAFAETGDNQGIINLGVNLAVSGQADFIDVLVETASNHQTVASLADLEFLLDDALFTPTNYQVLSEGKWLLFDVPLVADKFTARLKAQDSLAADNSASIFLPKNTIVNVAVSNTVHKSVFAVVNADSSIRLVDVENADVVIRQFGENFGTQLPALEFSQMSSTTPAFNLLYQGDKSMEQALADSLHELALDQIDATGLATATSLPIGVELSYAQIPSVQVWGSLLEQKFNFTQSKSYPLFIVQSIRWLSDSYGWQPYLSAGSELYQQDSLYGLSTMKGRFQHNLNGQTYLASAGEQNVGEYKAFVSLTNAEVTKASAETTDYSLATVQSVLSNFSEFMTLLILAILLLLVAEWIVYQRGLMP